jgi:hypothetical protein
MLHVVARRVRAGDTLHEVVFAASMERAAKLVVHRRFRQLMRAGGAFATDFAAGLAAHYTLKHTAQCQRAEAREKRAQDEVASMQSDLREQWERVGELQKKLTRYDQLLEKFSCCRHCDADFSCYLDTDENCLRCSKCRTRHF